VIAEDEIHAAAGFARLGFERVEQPEDFGLVRAPVEGIAEYHQVASIETPMQLRIDDTVFHQHGDQDFVFAVGIRHHEQRGCLHRRDLVGRQLRRRTQLERKCRHATDGRDHHPGTGLERLDLFAGAVGRIFDGPHLELSAGVAHHVGRIEVGRRGRPGREQQQRAKQTAGRQVQG